MEFGQALNATAGDDGDAEIPAVWQEVAESGCVWCAVRQKLPAPCGSPCSVLTETVTEADS